MGDGEAAENQTTVNHEEAASCDVVLHEIAWFKTLDEEIVERIADTAPPGSPELDYATAELRRRRRAYSTRAPAP
jgi:hypothetical protein